MPEPAAKTSDPRELISFISRALVDSPEEVEVTAVEGDGETVYELRVAEADLGKIIGKNGRTIRALRTLLAASNLGTDADRAVLEVLE